MIVLWPKADFLNLFSCVMRPACKRSCNRLSLLMICTVGVLLALLYYFIFKLRTLFFKSKSWTRCNLFMNYWVFMIHSSRTDKLNGEWSVWIVGLNVKVDICTFWYLQIFNLLGEAITAAQVQLFTPHWHFLS